MKCTSLLLLFLGPCLFLTEFAYGEVSCSSTVSFKWVSSVGEGKEASAKEMEVHWSTLTVNGTTEEDAKSKLQPLIERNRNQAGLICRQQHENLSGCMAARYIAMGGAYSNLGFSAKKSMDDAIREDCAKKQGKCSGAFSTEPECKELTAEAEAEKDAKEGEESGEKGGDKKGGEKKEGGKK